MGIFTGDGGKHRRRDDLPKQTAADREIAKERSQETTQQQEQWEKDRQKGGPAGAGVD